MPGPVCKILIDNGRLQAAAEQVATQGAAAAEMLRAGLDAGDIDPNDPRVAALSDEMCKCAIRMEGFSRKFFKLATEIHSGGY